MEALSRLAMILQENPISDPKQPSDIHKLKLAEHSFGRSPLLSRKEPSTAEFKADAWTW
jgi:hypothetical protein